MHAGIENRVHYENPKAGKLALFTGKAERVLGYISAGAGLAGWALDNIPIPNLQNSEGVIPFLEKSYGPLLYVGGGLLAVGIVSGTVGKIQHWWANKNYYS